MDMIMVSLGENEGKQGEEVVIYGKQQGAEISVDEIAEMLGTISYEVLSVLSRRVPAFISETAKSLKYQLRYYTCRRHRSRFYV